MFNYFSTSLSLFLSLSHSPTNTHTHSHSHTLTLSLEHTRAHAHPPTRIFPTNNESESLDLAAVDLCLFICSRLITILVECYFTPSLSLSFSLCYSLHYSHTRKYIHAIIFPSYLSLSNTLTHTDLLIHPPTPTRTHKYVPNTVSIADQQTLFSSGPKNSSSETQTYWETLELELAQVRSRSYKKFSV